MHFCKKHIHLSLLWLFASLFVNGQLIGTKTFTIGSEGSPTKFLSLIKSGKGFLIAGTTDGVYRFNGNAFQPYSFDTSVKNREVTAIAEGKEDTVWVGFKTGEIGFIKDNIVNLLITEEGHPKVAITSIVADRDKVFFATAGEGIYYYFNRRFYNIDVDDGLSDNFVYDVKLIKTNSIIAGTDHGINVCSIVDGKKKISSYAANAGIPDNIVRSLSLQQGSRYLFGMQDVGAGLFDVSTHHFQPLYKNKEWNYGQVNAVLDAASEVWAATETNGLIKLVDSSAIKASFSNDMSFSKASHLLRDGEGNIWFSSNNQLVRTSGTQLQNLVPFGKNLFDQVHTILADNQNGIWINYNNGLKHFQLKNSNWQGKDIVMPFISQGVDITSLYQDKFGNIWIGTMGKGIVVLDANTGKTRIVTEDEALKNGSILSINGRDNDIWISSLSGPVKCTLNENNKQINSTYTFTNFNNASGIGSNYVYSILADRNNRVWFATDGRGITLLQNGKFINYGEKNGIKSKVIYSICEDNEGNIWFSTLNAGIYKFDGKRFTNISVDKGLNDATVTSLSIDSKGNVLALTKRGINIVDSKTLRIAYVDADEGVNEWNDDLNCVTKTSAGNSLFVSSIGIISFLPQYTSLQPKIVIDNIQLFLKDIPVNEGQNFSYDENNFSFAFSGISLSHPSKVQYQYKLVGLSNEWISTRDNKVNFPKLPPGNYTFAVRASLNSNFSGAAEVTYRFVIQKPFWWQWWFVVLATVSLGLLLYWYIKSRETTTQRWERLEKERIQSQFETLKSQVNPHFLFNSFNTLISVIEENPTKAVEYVEHLSDFYRKIVTYRDKDLISLEEEMELINDYYFIQQKRFGNNLRLNMDVSKEELHTYLIAPLTLQLLAENAVKHNAISAETPLTIDIGIADKYLIVRNNLNPKLSVEKGAGMGLQNIQNRYKLLNTDAVKIEKTATDFDVYIPLIKAG